MSGGRRGSDEAERAQANVVGVAILLGVTMLSLGVLTASIGTVVESNAAAADADRVAADLDAALDPVATTGPGRGRVSFTDGRLRTVERTVRVVNDSGVVATEEVGGLVFTSDRQRVAFVGGAVVRGTGSTARMYTEPPIAASRGVLLVGVGRLNASGPDAVGGSGPTSVVLRTNVTHDRRALGDGTYRVAVETETPGAWESHFERQNATTERRTFDGDGVESVVAEFPGNRTTYFVEHDLRTEVRRG
ncbi:DUF7289 family protein [Halegenticoccus tardaugens]|uniref:DUF7289 family protein n=1 Tax=Halegenticoccus tardaugens TaxID=2071624 RepID=UPI00100BA9C2|nr:hypothetical protein [Halegenticoccus tardaugens]